MKKNTVIKIIMVLILVLLIGSLNKSYAETKNNNPLLREILIDGKQIEPQFDQFITDYVMAVDSSKEKINIEAVTDDPNAKAEIIGDTNLKSGKNDFEIKVTAEDGKTKNSYFLHITRGDVGKANANLKNIEVEGLVLNPKFNEKDTKYLVEYDGYIEKLNISAITENQNAKIEILDNSNFNSTTHIVTIKVTAEDGITTKEYKITAKKSGEDVENASGLGEYENNIQSNTKDDGKQSNYIYIGIPVVLIILISTIILIMNNNKDKKSK